jgi:integrase
VLAPQPHESGIIGITPGGLVGAYGHQIEAHGDDLAGKFAAILDAWMMELTPKTVKCYRSDLAHLARWLNTDGAPVDPDDRLAALVWLLGRGQAEAHTTARRWLASMASPRTRARRRSCLRSFAARLVEAGALTYPLALTTRAQSDRVAPNPDARPTIAPDLVAALWESTAGHTRDRAVLALLIHAGLRSFEVVGLDIDHLDLPGGSLLVPRKMTGTEMAGVELARPVVVALHAHIAGRTSGPVFVSTSGPTAGARLQPEAVGAVLARCCARAGVPRITPHSLRHHGATLLAVAGADAGEIQDWLGHASSEAARSYIMAAGRRARRRAAADRIEAILAPILHEEEPSA